jgi:hypothetical protein
VAFGSLARSPGATTLLLATAAVWPTGDVVVVEADADGGVLAARFGLSLHPEAPTLMSLLAATRHDPADGSLVQHRQRLPGGIGVVCGPSNGDVAAGAVEQLAIRWAALRGAADGDVFVDVGRLRPNAAGWRLAAGCDSRVVVVRPCVDELEPLLGRLDGLSSLGPLAVAVRGTGPYTVADVADAVGSDAVVVPVADDARGVAVLYGRRAGRLARSGIVRSGRTVVGAVGVGVLVR